MLRDGGADMQTRRSEPSVHQDAGVRITELQDRQGGGAGRDNRCRAETIIRDRDRCGRTQDQSSRIDRGRPQINGRRGGATFIIKGQTGEGLRGARAVVGESQRTATIDRNVRGGCDLIGHGGTHRHRGVSDCQVARDGPEAGSRVKVQRAAVGKGSTRISVRGELRSQRKRLRAVRNNRTRADDGRLNRRRILIDIEIKVATNGSGNRVGGICRRQSRAKGRILDDTDTESDGGGRREGDSLGCRRREAPGIGYRSPGGERTSRTSITIITRCHGRRYTGSGGAHIGAGITDSGETTVIRPEVADAESRGVGRETRSVGDRPAAEEIISQNGGRTIHLCQENIAIRAQALAA